MIALTTYRLFSCYFFIVFVYLLINANVAAAKEYSPSLNPLVVQSETEKKLDISKIQTASNTGKTEWTFHKTLDGLHPDGQEQQAVWLMNRARANPNQEGLWLASSNDYSVAGGRNYFGVDLDILRAEFAAIVIKPPVAFDNRLYAAAFAHSTDLIERDAQDHDQQYARVQDAGFHVWGAFRGSVFSYAKSGINAHAAWNIDWGPDAIPDDDGMQAGRGHRVALMSIGGENTNVGIAAIHETNSSTDVGPYVSTANYCQANSYYADHYNTFIVGTVWHDANGNDQYDPGEGKSNVIVNPDQGSYYAVTSVSGGYAIPITSNTIYTVTFSGGDLAGKYIKSTVVNGQSVLVDIETGSDSPIPTQNYPLPAIMLLLE